MDHQLSLNEIALETNNIEEDVKMQQTLESSKIGDCNIIIWYKIFKYLSDEDLANVSIVCKGFQCLAKNAFVNRYRKRTFRVSFLKIDWKPVICRFKNQIKEVDVHGTEDGIYDKVPKNLQRDFTFFENCMSESLEKLRFHGMGSKPLQQIVVRKKFRKVEELSFRSCTFNSTAKTMPFFHYIQYSFPNLKSLKTLGCDVQSSRFIEQYLPTVSVVSYDLRGAHIDCFLIFLIKNPQLRHLVVNLSQLPDKSNMSCLPMVNEILTNLESLVWCCHGFEFLPSFRKNFENVKSLKFGMGKKATYRNELLKIIKFFPRIQEIQIIQCSKNLMTNDDLIELLSQGSSTLKTLVFKSHSLEKELKFSYDLHRNVCDVTSDRPDINFEFAFEPYLAGEPFLKPENWMKRNGEIIVWGNSEFAFEPYLVGERFLITKNWIKRNGEIIVLAES